MQIAIMGERKNYCKGERNQFLNDTFYVKMSLMYFQSYKFKIMRPTVTILVLLVNSELNTKTALVQSISVTCV